MNVNINGGYFATGSPYDMGKKMEVLQAYLEVVGDDPDTPKFHVKLVLAMASSLCWQWQRYPLDMPTRSSASTLLQGLWRTQRRHNNASIQKRQQYTKIGAEELILLLALQAEDDSQYLVDYQRKLYQTMGVCVCFFKDVYNDSVRANPLMTFVQKIGEVVRRILSQMLCRIMGS
jgi:hypothetical protein